jgi:gamma-glutamyltranspeptidase/glutathione hydrolase
LTGRKSLNPGLSGAAALALVVLLAGCETPAPDNLLAHQSEAERSAKHFMVSTAHPLATEAGLAVLRDGGNAVDAAVAVQMVLGFVEAPETGIGGGGFLLFRDGASGALRFYDGRETAPLAANAERFLLLGQPLPLAAAVPTGRAVGVPGLVAMLGLAHENHGSHAWAELLQPAIELAESGTPMPDRLQRQIREDNSLRLFSDMRRMFVDPAAEEAPRLANQQYAETLRTLAREGPQAFYGGPIARDIAARAASRLLWPGDLTEEDFAAYRAIERDAVCGVYREWTVCGAPPPSSGGIAVLQILGLLERFPLAELGPDSVESIHLVAEACRLPFADRYRYLGDPAFVDVPLADLLARDYLARRSMLIDPARAMVEAKPGEPGRRTVIPEAEPGDEQETLGTSHFSIVDGDDNLVALTSSIEAPFGARMSTRGFLLNNQLTDFTFDPALEDGRLHPNAVAPGKRPRSSMSPVMVFDADGNVRLVIGSRGGARIIGYVVKALIGVLDWNLDVQDAVALPNFVHRGQMLELERGSVLERHRSALEALGHDVKLVRMTSGLHGMERIDGGWRGAADPRLDGVASGE